MDDVRAISSFSRTPIFMVHDPRMGGMTRAVRFFSLIAAARPANEMIFELYYPAGDDFFALVQDSVPKWSAEITLESPDERVRRTNGKFPWSNEVAEQTMASALAHGCRKLDVFFMMGLPHQPREDAERIAAYAERLVARFGGRVRPFVAPLGPFLDPGSRAFEDAGLGYTSLCRTLDDHRRALLHDSWERILSYHTDTMTRAEIVRATYDAAAWINDVKRRYRVIDESTYAAVTTRLGAARRLLDEESSGPEQVRRLWIELANHRTMFGDDELKWPVRHRFRVGGRLVAGLAAGLGCEIAHAVARMLGRYDVAPVSMRAPGARVA